jgi:hypothetical protein
MLQELLHVDDLTRDTIVFNTFVAMQVSAFFMPSMHWHRPDAALHS